VNALKVTPFMCALRLRTGGFPLLRISSLGFDVEIFAAPPASIGATNTRKGTRRAISSLAKRLAGRSHHWQRVFAYSRHQTAAHVSHGPNAVAQVVVVSNPRIGGCSFSESFDGTPDAEVIV
jgi:hypothetical protein